MLERLARTLERHAPGDQTAQPVLVGALQRARRHLVMPPIGVDRAEHAVVVEDQAPVERADVDLRGPARQRDPGKTDDAGRRRGTETRLNDGRRPRALNQDIRRQTTKIAGVDVVCPTEIAYQLLL